jgi:uncharacterized glyoxalase superfamily protein PhnB
MAGTITLKSLAPVLLVDRIEPCLGFWVDQLGFTLTVTVPEGEHLGFAIVAKDGLEIMYQTHDSVANDAPTLAGMSGTAAVYIQVAELDPVIERLGAIEVVVPRRRTFYGADEIFVRTHGGHVVGFAAMGQE